uniref:Uncharacterized protein n=1 Tax=Panagrolaimus davidi TaxID=227884 RepID=A0A914PWC2_9BILA
MFRRGRYQQLKNAEADEDENNRLEFVGTSSELFSPNFQHRQDLQQKHSTSTFQNHYRQTAGKENAEQHSKTPVSTANTKTSAANSTPKNGIATDDQLTKVIGILYFMSWTVSFYKNILIFPA